MSVGAGASFSMTERCRAKSSRVASAPELIAAKDDAELGAKATQLPFSLLPNSDMALELEAPATMAM
jgi:hypothetical protein